MIRDRTFTYVNYALIPDFLAVGWMVVIPNGVHRQMHHYGIVMEWCCDCKMVKPR